MNEYHKIQTIFKRDSTQRTKPIIEGDYSLPEFEYLADNEWVFTEKVDGTNIRVMWDRDGKVTFGGKTDTAQIPAKLVTRLNERFTSNYSLAGYCLYGEGHGAGIQKGGRNYRHDQDFVLFDVKVGDWWLQREDVAGIAHLLAVPIVPIIGTGSLYKAVNMVRDGMKSTYGDFEAEGIVARPEVEMNRRNGDRIITKIKCRDFKV